MGRESRSLPHSEAAKKIMMLDYTKSEITGSAQPWFNAQFASMDALASSLNYTLS